MAMNKFKVKDLVRIKDQKVVMMLGILEPQNSESFKKELEVTFVSTLFRDGSPIPIYRCTPIGKYFSPLNEYSFEGDQLEKL
jgi:hypothetical protein